LPKEGGELQIFFKTLDQKFSSRTQKNSPTRSTKANSSMVGGMFVVTAMN